MHRIGWLATTPPTTAEQRSGVEAFEHRLRELGYVEGKNLVIERRYDEGKYERLPTLTAELVRLKVDVIVASTTPRAQAARQATREIPIVMLAVVDPVGAGLVASLARLGGNVTGLTILSKELSAKRLQLLKEVAPGLARVAVLWNPGNWSNKLQLDETREAAKILGVHLQPLEIRSPEDVEGTFHAASRERAGALLVLDDPLIFYQHRRIAGLAAKDRLATLSGLRAFVEAGGLMSYGTSLDEHFRQTAVYVDKIPKGAKPADLPIEQPTKFELVINLRTAKALGVRFPPAVLLCADRVIE